MQKLIMWHNIACSKSNSAKCYLDDNGIKIEVRNYLENPPSKIEIEEVLKKLNLKAKELLRDNEELYTTLNLKDEDDEEKIIEIMVQNPILIQRPIIVGHKKAFIARPPARMEDILNEF